MNNNTKFLLTTENLKELEEHCKRQVQRYETNKKIKEEHLLILELLCSYNQNETKANKYDSLIKEIEDKINNEELPLVIVGGRRNCKTLNYGIKLGRRQVLQELLDTEKEKV